MSWTPRIAAMAMAISVAGAGLAFALESPDGDPDVVELLSGLSYEPDRLSIDTVLGPAAVDQLINIAEDETVGSDPGLRIRAYRALGQYGQTPDAGEAISALRRAINKFRRDQVGTNVLLLRVSMLSLAKIDGPNAVAVLVGMLTHQSRDIRAACAQALGITGSSAAEQPLRDRALVEEQAQVQLAISDALFQLESAP